MVAAAYNRLVSDLPLYIFENLVSCTRDSRLRRSTSSVKPINENATTTSALLRLQIVLKLQVVGSANNGGNQPITTVQELLNMSPSNLVRILDPCLTYVECNRFLSRIHEECASRPQSALELMCKGNASSSYEKNTFTFNQKIPTGLATLDHHLMGGIPTGSITELVGRAGVGKTHLAQQLAVSAANVDGGTVYIDAEKKLSLNRLQEIAFERSHLTNRNRREQSQLVLENVTIHSLLSTSELLDVLDRLEDEIILRNSEASLARKSEVCENDYAKRYPVRLVIVDSIAAPLRRDFDVIGDASSSNTASKRATAIFRIAKRLKQLAHDYQLAVLVINQVGSGKNTSNKKSEDINHQNHNLDINDGEFAASLGTAWQYCVSTRIILQHDSDPHRLQSEGMQDSARSHCTAALSKSLVSRRITLSYELTKQGLCEVLSCHDGL